MPKIRSFAADFNDRMCQLSFLHEIWEKVDNKRHSYKIEELLEMSGIKYISTPRSGKRSGGGAAIAASSENYHLSKLNIIVPHNLEIVWGLLKPKHASGKINQIIVCSFYCPPSYNSKKKSLLVDHMMETIQSLRISYPDAGVIVSGDRNDLSLVKLATIDVSLKQIVKKNTHGTKVLTVILTDLYDFYSEPEIIPPVDVDDSNDGVPSDHSGVLLCPVVAESTLKPEKIT